MRLLGGLAGRHVHLLLGDIQLRTAGRQLFKQIGIQSDSCVGAETGSRMGCFRKRSSIVGNRFKQTGILSMNRP